MRRVTALVRALFLWALPVLVVILLWRPIGDLVGGGLLQSGLALLLAIFLLSLGRASFTLSRDLLTGRYDEARAAARSAAPAATRSAARGCLANIGLLLLSGLVTLLVLEFVFRAFLPQPLYAVAYTSWGFWHMPNTCILHGAEPSYENSILRGTEFVTHICYNAVGMRDVDRPTAKPPGTKRVLVLGDSYAEAMEVEDAQTSAKVLERLLNADIASLARAARPATNDRRGSEPTGNVPDVPTRAIFRQLHQEAAAQDAPVLMALVHRTFYRPELERRIGFLEANGIYWVDVPDEDHERYHFRFDGHWNVAGNQRAAELIHAKIRDAGLLGGDPSLQRVEVLNAGMSAYSSCKELRIYQEIGRRFDPDLVLRIYTGSDERNAEDADICLVDGSGNLTIRERTYSTVQHVVRGIRSWIKTQSHFLTWVSGRLDELPLLREMRTKLTGPDVPYVDQPSPSPSPGE